MHFYLRDKKGRGMRERDGTIIDYFKDDGDYYSNTGRDEVKISGGNECIRYATVDVEGSLIIEDLDMLVSLLVYGGASSMQADCYLKVKDSKSGHKFEIKYLGRDE